jgi:hypothetical protein
MESYSLYENIANFSMNPSTRLWLRFSARPKIVKGRFIFYTIWTFEENGAKPMLKTIRNLLAKRDLRTVRDQKAVGDHRFCFCIHSHANWERTTPSMEAIRAAYLTGKQDLTTFHSCDDYPTDYSITIQPESLTFEVWQDLGSGVAPSDELWVDHIWEVSSRKWWERPKIPYVHGSIRDLYNSV